MRIIKSIALVLLLALVSINSNADVTVGEAAPGFELTDTKGQVHKLSDYQGKTVVLEWFNHSCPFVVKHYKSGNMQALQKKYTGAGVVWLSINSGSKDSGSYVDRENSDRLTAENKAAPSAVLLDETGTVGKAYGAKTTPHMFIIDASGVLRYQGAIDSISSPDQEDIVKSDNYVSLALDAISQGKEVVPSVTKSYGCSVKY